MTITYTITCIEKEILSRTKIPSFFRTEALSGSRYVPDFLSGKIEVFHLVFLIVTMTGSDPQPFALAPYFSLISVDCFFGIPRKCHPAMPGYNHTSDFIL